MNLNADDEIKQAFKRKSTRKTYKCEKDGCSKSFSKQHEIKRHRQAHLKGTLGKSTKILVGKKMYECDVAGCSEAYTRLWSLTRHKQKKHGDGQNDLKSKSDAPRRYRCEELDCEAFFMRADRLEAHKVAFHFGERPYKCDFEGCDKSYKIDPHLKRHKLAAHSPEIRPVVYCKINDCGKIYYNTSSLKTHIATVHTLSFQKSEENEYQQGSIAKPISIKRKACDVEKRHQCDQPGCDAAFRRPYRLKYHKITFHGGEKPFICEEEGCGKKYTSNSHLMRHILLIHKRDVAATEMKLICGVEGCGKIYSNKYSLRKHIRKKHPYRLLKFEESNDDSQGHKEDRFIELEGSYKCDEEDCNAEFTRSDRLTSHKLALHRGERPFKCVHQDCGKSYTKQSHLVRHKVTSHDPQGTIVKQVMCKLDGCGKICFNNCSLRKHIARNHQDFPFKCIECDEKFKRKYQLHKHEIETHGREASYKCNECPKILVHYHQFNKHLKTHKIHQCDCEKTFGKWSKLLVHRRNDCTVKWKEHKCQICGKGFSLKYNLMLHFIMVHKSESQVNLRCPYLNCKQSYKYKWNLDYHIESYHEGMFQENSELDLCDNVSAKIQENEGVSRKRKSTGKKRVHRCGSEGCTRSFRTLNKLKKHLQVHFKTLKIKSEITEN